MSRSSSPPPRWLRRTMIFGPVTGLSVVTGAVFVARPTLFDAVSVSMCVLALVPLLSVARKELRAERHVTPAMETRYFTLSRLLDSAGADDVLVDADEDVAIMLVRNHDKDGSVLRSILRFDRTEFDQAGQDGMPTPMVFEQFFLDLARPVVRVRVSALAITRTEDGGVSISAMPPQRRKRREVARMDRLVASMAADIPLVTDLDVLIDQVQSSTART